jgi:VWFA-related protein
MEGEKLQAARAAALEFLTALEPGDEGTVVTFSDTVRIVQDLTADRNALAAAIRKAEAQAGTALYDAIWRTSNQLEKFDGRRVLVLLSDGRDEASSGLEPGSLHTLDEAMDRALRNEVMIFAIGFGKNLDAELDFYRRQTLADVFKKLAEPTGGRVIFSSRASKLSRAFEVVAEDLRHQYSLAYISDDPRHDGAWRQIRLTSTRPNVKVTGRRGYFAPLDPTGALSLPAPSSREETTGRSAD